jgi:hypothetical protein
VLSCCAAPVSVNYENGIYHIVLKGEKIKKKMKFAVSENLITNKEAHIKSGARLTVNAGFFDPENAKTISYVVTDRQTAADPLFNENLMNNPVLRRNIDKVINRTEFRLIECDNKYHYEITPHKSAVDFGCNIISSCQGGPLIYPELRLEEEFFIVRQDGKVIRESASVLHRTARTVIGLKGTDEVHILIITKENPMDMYEVQAYCRELGLDRAMGFDGGGSTSMNYLNKYSVTSEGDGRSLKSFLLISK